MTAAQSVKAALAAGMAPKPFGAQGGGYASYRANVKAAELRCSKHGHKHYGASELQCCAYCGKLAIGTKFFIYTKTGEVFGREDDDVHHADIGYCNVGSDCAKRLKKAGVTVYEQDPCDPYSFVESK